MRLYTDVNYESLRHVFHSTAYTSQSVHKIFMCTEAVHLTSIGSLDLAAPFYRIDDCALRQPGR